jgi:hypothetical protein
MQQIKIFTTDSGFRENWVSADDKANKWLSENPNVRVLDMRYQANVSGFADSGVSASDFHESICLLYEISDIVITSRTEDVLLSDKRDYSSEKYKVDFD